MNIFYLASPYTHEDKKVEQKRFRDVCRWAAWLKTVGICSFCPIAMSHPISTHSGKYDIGTGYDAHQDFDLSMLERSDGLIVVMIEGWKESKGVQDEINHAKKLKKPIMYLEV